ncbi:hypothetical protein JD82_04906 [Prauserella rugosa]|uniref:DUF222 domain-containing protein n=1 Tax=Prauserella rugosa TaxID=43354 RepID=A0A660CKL4_9PSEU|nr:hypothetical protein JD82_04906 [Prauserella rugosa]
MTSPLSDEHARQVDALLSDKLASAPATSWQPRNLAQHAARLVEKVDPGGQAERARMARAGRRVELDHGPNAQSRLTAELPSEVASACYARVDAMARRLRRDGEQRTLDQLRPTSPPTSPRQRPGVRVPEAAATVYLHMPIDAALSISDSGCELDGYGPIPAAVAREIMTNTDSVWRKVLCDPPPASRSTWVVVDDGPTQPSANSSASATANASCPGVDVLLGTATSTTNASGPPTTGPPPPLTPHHGVDGIIE